MNCDLNKSFLPVAQEWVQRCLEGWDTVDINQTRFPTYCAINILSPNTPPSPPISRHLHQVPMAPCTLHLTKDVPPGFLSRLMKTYRGRRGGAGWGVQLTPRTCDLVKRVVRRSNDRVISSELWVDGCTKMLPPTLLFYFIAFRQHPA